MEEGEERVRGGREMGEGRGGKRGEEGGMGCWSVPRCFCVLLSCKNQRIKKKMEGWEKGCCLYVYTHNYLYEIMFALRSSCGCFRGAFPSNLWGWIYRSPQEAECSECQKA